MPDIIDARTLGIVADGLTDDTVALQAAFDAGKNGHLLQLPAGRIKITKRITLDPSAAFNVEGVGYDINGGASGTTIFQAGADHSLFLSDPTNSGSDKPVLLRRFGIFGGTFSLDGLHVEYIHGLATEDLWISGNQGTGLYARQCFSSTFTRTHAVHNQRFGIQLHEMSNKVSVRDCKVNSNAQISGYANFALTGSAGSENLGVELSNVDWTASGSFGAVFKNTWGLHIHGGCYAEKAVNELVYMDQTVRALVMEGNYFQDGVVKLDGTMNAVVRANIFRRMSAPTQLAISSPTANDVEVGQNAFLGGATQILA